MSMTVCSDGCAPGIDLTVEIALTSAIGLAGLWDVALWDAGLWGPDVVWVDVSDWVRSITTDRGFDARMRTWQAGKCAVVLDNRDGRFSPDNLDPAAPYVVAGVSGVRPGCPIRITAAYGGVTFPVFRGYVSVWSEGWALHEPREGDAFMTAEGVDEWGRLGRAKGWAVAPVGASETFGERIVRLLNAAGFTGATQIAAGLTTMQATDLSDERVTEINKTAQSEGGTVHAEADGTIIARDRYGLVNDPRSITPQATFGDGPGETTWSSIAVAPVSDSTIINHATYARAGGADQSYVDPVSVAIYGQCDDPETANDLLCETNAQVAALAQWAVLVGKDPEARIEQLTFAPRGDLPTMAPLLLGLLIRDLTTVTIRPPTAYAPALHVMARACFVAGIAHTFTDNDWTPTLRFASATALYAFAGSRWDVGLWGSADTDPAAARWFV